MYAKLIPILSVADVRKERSFYEALGFELHVDSAETYPEDQFAALAFGAHILFGLVLAPDASPLTDAGLFWQVETTDIDAVHARATEHGLLVLEPPTRQAWGRRTMTLGSPCGYRVGFEESAG
jgi:catechol 2,3-dioxygenase-like lactoylglutathione lyase family enzyme